MPYTYIKNINNNILNLNYINEEFKKKEHFENVNNSDKVINNYNKINEEISNFEKNITNLSNINDFDKILEDIKNYDKTYLFHLAAKTSVTKSFINPNETILTNTKLLIESLEFCRKNKTKLVFFSTTYQFEKKTIYFNNFTKL